jgi:hypothetical protein
VFISKSGQRVIVKQLPEGSPESQAVLFLIERNAQGKQQEPRTIAVPARKLSPNLKFGIYTNDDTFQVVHLSTLRKRVVATSE